MAELQATLTDGGQLFFWTTSEDRLERAIRRELPELLDCDPVKGKASLALPGPPLKRQKVGGMHVDVHRALVALGNARRRRLTASLGTWAQAAMLGLELAASQRVVPAVEMKDRTARWRVLLVRDEDRHRFRHLVDTLPTAARAQPASSRGKVRLVTAEVAVRRFLDAAVDGVYRQDAWPGTVKGWALEFANALRGGEPGFAPRDARFQGVPERLTEWSTAHEQGALRVGLSLGLPEDGGDTFPLTAFVHSDGQRAAIDEPWTAGTRFGLGGREHAHPAHAVLAQLARAARVDPLLSGMLRGSRPQTVALPVGEAWGLLAEGVELLRAAGFLVEIPAAFEAAGSRRIRARMRVAGPDDGPIDLEDVLRFSWEVVLGGHVLEGADFAELLERREPIVRFRGDWVLLDPVELERLPSGLPQEGDISTVDALRAVLTGELDGVPVVADERLQAVVDALQNPPAQRVPEGLQGTLRPYQHRGFSWLQVLGRLGLGCCLADDMGLGKTIQVIAHLLARQRRPGPSLVVCPTSVLGNWRVELERFGPSLRVAHYHGLYRDAAVFDRVDVVLTSYGLLVRDREILAEVDWDVIALDEAQAIKNPDSQRARAARSLSGAHIIALTGTPMENRLDELWSLFEFLLPGYLGARATFQRQVAVPVERFGDDRVAGALRKGTAPFLLRRLKTDPTVISDLPDKVERRSWCRLTPEQAELYQRVVDEHMGRITSTRDVERRGHVLAMLTRLKQVCNHPAQYLDDAEGTALDDRSGKLERLVDLLETILELGESVIIFTQYRQMGSRLATHLEEVFRLDAPVPFLHGGTPPGRRDEMVADFQDDPLSCPILLVSLRAGGTGLNLTRASHVVHYDRWWNPAVEDQATDRAYRIGQKRNVQVHKLICRGTLEERIDHLLEEKRALADAVVGSGEAWVTELDDAALRQLVTLGHEATED